MRPSLVLAAVVMGCHGELKGAQFYGIARDGDYVYFATVGDGQLGKILVDGGGLVELASIYDASPATQLAIDSRFVYWSGALLPGGLWRIPK